MAGIKEGLRGGVTTGRKRSLRSLRPEVEDDRWVPPVSLEEKKRKRRKLERERGAAGGLAWLGRCLAGPRAWPGWVVFLFFLF
jgi:hypothetical protein